MVVENKHLAIPVEPGTIPIPVGSPNFSPPTKSYNFSKKQNKHEK